jgi:hypothetical protein
LREIQKVFVLDLGWLDLVFSINSPPAFVDGVFALLLESRKAGEPTTKPIVL